MLWQIWRLICCFHTFITLVTISIAISLSSAPLHLGQNLTSNFNIRYHSVVQFHDFIHLTKEHIFHAHLLCLFITSLYFHIIRFYFFFPQCHAAFALTYEWFSILLAGVYCPHKPVTWWQWLKICSILLKLFIKLWQVKVGTEILMKETKLNIPIFPGS